MAEILRGEIYWADLEPTEGREQAGRRPVLVVSHDLFNERSQTIVAMAITSHPQRAGYPLTWQIPNGILPKQFSVKISQIRTLSTNRLGDRMGAIDEKSLREIVAGLVQIIG